MEYNFKHYQKVLIAAALSNKKEKFFTTSVMERIEFILEKIEKKEESILVLDYDTAA